MVERWKQNGGELVQLPQADQEKLRTLLASVGDEVTKGDPKLHAFYKRVHETGKKY